MSDQVLNQEEIDALLNSISGIDTTGAPPAPPEGIRPYDFSSEMRVVRGRMPTLEMINERFARQFRLSLYNVLRRSAEIATGPVQLKKFSEYIRSLHLPTSLNIVKFNPLRGLALIAFDPKLVFAVVDTAFGGHGRHAKIEGRDFSPTEVRLIRSLLNRVFVDLAEAWAPVQEISLELIGAEMNPHFANIVSPTEVVVVTSFAVDLDGCGGEIHITMPYSMIEPLREVLDAGLQSDRSDRDERWSLMLHDALCDAIVTLRTVLGESRMTLADLINLKPGDVVSVDFEGQATLCTEEGIPLFAGKLGISRGCNAVQLTGNARPANSKGPSMLATLQNKSKAHA